MNERRLDQCRTSRPARTLFALAMGALLAPAGLMGCASSTSSGSTYHDADRPNPGSEGFVPLFSRLSTATNPLPERVVAFDGFQTVGLAVLPDGRLFLSSPRWHGGHGDSVVEVKSGTFDPPSPYPNEAWNRWRPGVRPERSWVTVQALHADDQGNLWVLDPGVLRDGGRVEGGPKLIRFNPGTDRVSASFLFDETIAPEGSYLNDVRIDTERGFAYMSDSGLGAIVALDLTTGAAARFLEDHPSTKADENESIIIEGEPWLNESGLTPLVHADGIALSPKGDFIYYQALTGRTLYRVPTAPIQSALRSMQSESSGAQPRASTDIGGYVQDLGTTFVTDAMIMDDNGVLYFTALEKNGITARLPSGELVPVTADERISWPDSFAIHGGRLYFTIARIHETGFGRSEGPFAQGTYGVFRVPLIDPR